MNIDELMQFDSLLTFPCLSSEQSDSLCDGKGNGACSRKPVNKLPVLIPQDTECKMKTVEIYSTNMFRRKVRRYQTKTEAHSSLCQKPLCGQIVQKPTSTRGFYPCKARSINHRKNDTLACRVEKCHIVENDGYCNVDYDCLKWFCSCFKHHFGFCKHCHYNIPQSYSTVRILV